jgi:hypothetical protein
LGAAAGKSHLHSPLGPGMNLKISGGANGL